MNRCEERIPAGFGVPCVLETGHEGDHQSVWSDPRTRCTYVFLDQGLPRPVCRRHIGHDGDHEPDR